MALGLGKIVEYRLNITPENVEIFVAEDKDGKRIGAFAAGYDAALKESMYILGYFLPEAAKMQPMTALVHAWMVRSQELGLTSCNFGLMCGPYAGRWDPWWGLSNFKTHFGIHRVHLPPGYWKVTFSWQKK